MPSLMTYDSVKNALYASGLNWEEAARRCKHPITASHLKMSVLRWAGKTGAPRGKTRLALQYIAEQTGVQVCPAISIKNR